MYTILRTHEYFRHRTGQTVDSTYVSNFNYNKYGVADFTHGPLTRDPLLQATYLKVLCL